MHAYSHRSIKGEEKGREDKRDERGGEGEEEAGVVQPPFLMDSVGWRDRGMDWFQERADR